MFTIVDKTKHASSQTTNGYDQRLESLFSLLF